MLKYGGDVTIKFMLCTYRVFLSYFLNLYIEFISVYVKDGKSQNDYESL